MVGSELNISISAEKLFSVGSFIVTNSIFTSLIISALILLFALWVRVELNSEKPSKLQNLAEWMVEAFYSLVYGVTNDHNKSRSFTPIIMSFFLFILLNNWFGLIPGVGTFGFKEKPEAEHAEVSTTILHQVQAAESINEIVVNQDHTEEASVAESHEESAESHGEKFVPYFRSGTADLNTTIALALFSVIATQVIGIRYQKLGYFKKFLNFSSPIMFFVGLLEIISEVAKVISFAFRLFGNVFAGEVLLAVITALVPIIAPMPFYGLELFVGFIQALVFSLLSLVFFNMATVSHDDH